MLDPVLSKVMTAEEEADYMKINTDNEQDIAAKYKVGHYYCVEILLKGIA